MNSVLLVYSQGIKEEAEFGPFRYENCPPHFYPQFAQLDFHIIVGERFQDYIEFPDDAYNKAVAHTTPVYVIVDGRPHWCPKRGPAVIQKQINAIKGIKEEFLKKPHPLRQQVVERMDKAVKYYNELKKKMER